ncbi:MULTISPECIES: lasso peptide biosynthesis B2 protein [unclassified Blastococcus]
MTRPRLLGRAVRHVARRPVTRAALTDLAAALQSRERVSALRAVVDGALVAAVLERQGVRPLLRDRSDLPQADPGDARRVAAAVDAGLAVLPVAPTCLRRSLTLLRELHRTGRGAVLHIGVRPGAGGIEAHAWVQVAGEVVNDDPALVGTYSELGAGEVERLMPRFS